MTDDDRIARLLPLYSSREENYLTAGVDACLFLLAVENEQLVHVAVNCEREESLI